ncbi:MAG TPA: hypothetical protein VGC41_07355 [Kofleriaceae bacterium]
MSGIIRVLGMVMHTNNHLESITVRQRGSRIRDAFFAACVALATVVGLTAVSTAATAATVTHVSK